MVFRALHGAPNKRITYNQLTGKIDAEDNIASDSEGDSASEFPN